MQKQIEFEQYCIDQANKLDDMNMAEITGRSNEMSMRMALIHALSSDPQAEFIKDEDVEWATGYVKHHLDRLIDIIKMRISGSDHERNKKEILEALKTRKTMARSMMHKRPPFSKHQTKYLNEILESLVEAGSIDFEDKAAEGRGRPARIYRALKV